MPGQYLRTNYRVTGGYVDSLALGNAFLMGSAAAGAGTPIQGLVIGSYSGNFPGGTGSNVISIEAASALASFFGCDAGVNGYKVFPFWIRPKMRDTQSAMVSSISAAIYWASLTTSAGASQFFVWAGGSDQSAFSGSTSAGLSAAFVYTGLVVSGP